MQTGLTSEFPAAVDLKNDAHQLGKEVGHAAQNRIVQPAISMADDARKAVQSGVKNAQAALSDGLDSTRHALNDSIAQTRDLAIQQRDLLAAWVSARPLTSVGIALVVGALLNSISHDRRR